MNTADRGDMFFDLEPSGCFSVAWHREIEKNHESLLTVIPLHSFYGNILGL